MPIFKTLRELQERERKYLLSEILKVKGLMPLLMKPRNNQPWSADDRAELRVHLRRLSDLSPYFMVLLLPGSFMLLPLLSWWLDRRRRCRSAEVAKQDLALVPLNSPSEITANVSSQIKQ